MKKYIYIITAILSFYACESELELDAPSELTTGGFWDSEEGARTAHTGLFASLRAEAGDLWLLGEIRSDVWGGRTYESPSNLSLIESSFTASTAPFGGWAGFYTQIHRVNDFLANVPNISFVNENDKKHLLGQAYGLRALYYYTLLKTWGDVPIILEPLTNVDPNGLSRERSPQNEVMDQIKKDIEASLSAFGSDSSFWEGNRNFWSKAATLALKGDVYIWSGNLLDGGNADFTEAKNALQQIGTMGVSLVSTIDDLWGVSNEGNSEFILHYSIKGTKLPISIIVLQAEQRKSIPNSTLRANR